LVQAGRVPENFTDARAKFIDPVLEAAHLPLDRFIIVPGNHDVDTSEIAPFVESGLRSELTTVEKINEFVDSALSINSTAYESALARMQKYFAFHDSLGLTGYISKTPFFNTRKMDIHGVSIGVAELNSAWRSIGKKEDKNNLIIGERVVDLAIHDLAGVDLTICVAHHPTDWLVEADTNAVENRIFAGFDLVCLGHIHRTSPYYRISPLGQSVISQSGTIYANRKYFNGYQTICWDEAIRKVTLDCRLYLDDPKRVFVPANNLAPNGRVEFDLGPRTDRSALSEIELFLRMGRSTIRRAANEHISFTRSGGAQPLEEISEAFVCPPLSIHPDTQQLIVGESSAQMEARQVDLDAVLRSPDHVLLLGDDETGRTSLIHFMAVRVSEGVCDESRVPAIVSTPLIARAGEYERAIKAYYGDIDLSSRDFNQAIKALPWLIFLDDFNAGNSAHLGQLAAIRKTYPNHRLVIVARSNQIKSIEETVDAAALRIDIGYLSRKNIRQLAQARYSGSLDVDREDPAYDLVMKHIIDARLPRTGYIVTLLLWAVEQNKLGEKLNEAVLLENLVAFLLGKAEFDAALRDQLDPRAQEFLLREIANELKSCGGWLESNRLLEFIIQYFLSRGLGFGAKEVLDQFIACGILLEQDGYVAFRYPCYQEYFIAVDLLYNPERLSSLLASPALIVLQFSREIDLWSSLARELHGADDALLRILEDAKLPDVSFDVDIGNLRYDGKEISFKPTRVRELLENPPTKDQIDELLDKAERQNPVSTSRARKPESEAAKVPTTLDETPNYSVQRQALKLLSRVARNADHEKLPIKSALVGKVVGAWSAHTFGLLTAFRTLIHDHEATITKNTELTPDDLQRLGNTITYLLVLADGIQVPTLLTSESLRAPLRTIALDEDSPEGVRFIAAISYAETWDEQAISLMNEFLRSLKNPILRQAALSKMLNDYRLQRYKKSKVKKFRELIVNYEVALGVPKIRKGAVMAELIEREKED